MGSGYALAGGVAAVRRRMGWLVCASALGFTLAAGAWGQTGTDGAIGGQVLSSAGAPIEGALVVARGVETGLAVRVHSGVKGEFLVVRLPVGEYVVTVEAAGVVLTLAGAGGGGAG